MEPVRTVLAATDFSTNASLALERAADLARRRAARLVLVTVFSPIGSSRVDLPLLPPDLEAEALEASRQRLEEEAAALHGEGLEVVSKLGRGVPAESIVQMARDEEADVIVVGTRGLEGFEHALLGSTAEAIVGRAPCPVLVVHPNDVQTLAPPSRILLSTDLSHDTEPVADAVLRLFGNRAKGDAPIHVVVAHADRIPPVLKPLLKSLTSADLLGFDQVEGHLRGELETIAAGLRERGFTTSVAVKEGEAAKTLVELAGAEHIDLISMSTHGRSGLRSLLMGSTARRVVQHAPCPVLAVPAPG